VVLPGGFDYYWLFLTGKIAGRGGVEEKSVDLCDVGVTDYTGRSQAS